MTDLISRLQSSAGPSRELDAEIALANGWTHYVPCDGDNPDLDYWRSPTGQICPAPPHYTESIDAALSGEDIVLVAEQNAKKGDPVKWMALQRPVKGRQSMAAFAHTEAIARRVAFMIACQKAKEDSKPSISAA